MRFRKSLSTYVGAVGAILIGAAVTLFVVFPALVIDLAYRTGDMGTSGDLPFDWRQAAIRWVIAILIDLFMFYFFVWRPLRTLRLSLDTPGLIVRKGDGEAFIDTESVRQQVMAALSGIQDIKRSEVNVNNESGKAIVQINITTEFNLNAPKKKSEINREVKRIVQDQLGVQIDGKPTINFTMTPPAPPLPLITSGGNAIPSSPAASYRLEPTMEPPVVSMPEEAPEPEEEEYTPPKPTGIELAKNDPIMGMTRGPIPTPQPTPQPVEDDTAKLPSDTPKTELPYVEDDADKPVSDD